MLELFITRLHRSLGIGFTDDGHEFERDTVWNSLYVNPRVALFNYPMKIESAIEWS